MGTLKKGLIASLSLAVSLSALSTSAFAEEIHVENGKTITTFDAPAELEDFKKEFGELDNAELTSVTVVRNNEDVINDMMYSPAAIYSIKNVSKTRGCGRNEIRRSTYLPPGGTMTVSTGMEATVTASGGISKGAVASNLGFSLNKKYSISDAQNISVPNGKRKTVKAFAELDIWNYSVHLGPVKTGSGSATKPVGVCFAQYTS
ncbi:hypothetical protein COJ48_24760 [Bacillus cereus]|nr:hypothetical protein COJ48_24760 [Bacillus cereus]